MQQYAYSRFHRSQGLACFFFFNFPLFRGKCVSFPYRAGKMFYVLHCRGQQHWRGLHMRTSFFLLCYVTLNAKVTGILIIMLLKKKR